MTILRSSNAPLALRRGKPVWSGPVQAEQWVRPSDWLTLTPPSASEQKFVGLIAVYNQTSNYVALRATVSSGTYTVDWGDGSAPVTVTSNTNAEYNYSYSSLSSSTDCSRGYRQAIVTVTPTTAGATFSLFGLNYRHSARTSTDTAPAWLDVAVSAPNATTLRLGGTNSTGTQTVALRMLEQATVVSHNTTTMAHMFNSCFSLQSVPLFNTANVTSMADMFRDCRSLQSVPLFNTANVTSMSSMFIGCSSLQSVPLFNTANVTDMTNMFFSCFSLQSVPLFNTANVTSMASMFSSCRSLQSVPLFNTANVTSMASMFSSCSSLRQIPELNLSKISSTANNNMSLTGSVNLGKAKLTGMRWTQSFSGTNLGATELDEMYTALVKLNPNITNVTATGTVVTYTVDDISAFVAARTVTITGVDPIAYNLTNVTVATVNIANSRFTVNNAATGTYVSGGIASLQDNRTITVTGNPGTTGDDPTIATNKGWTVTDS